MWGSSTCHLSHWHVWYPTGTCGASEPFMRAKGERSDSAHRVASGPYAAYVAERRYRLRRYSFTQRRVLRH
jgi:hypothetical protein